MASEAELGFLPGPFARQAGLWVRGRGMGDVHTALPAEVHAGVPPSSSGRVPIPVFRTEALHGRPGLQERAIHTEVLIGEELVATPLTQDPLEELPCHIVLQKPLPVLGEGRGIKSRIPNVQAQEPLEEQIVLEPLAKLPFTPI